MLVHQVWSWATRRLPVLFQGVRQDEDIDPDFRNPFAHISIKLTNDNSMSNQKARQGKTSSVNPDSRTGSHIYQMQFLEQGDPTVERVMSTSQKIYPLLLTHSCIKLR